MQQGLKENWRQYTLLVIINAFIGVMAGLERSVLPELAQEKFGVDRTFLTGIVKNTTVKDFPECIGVFRFGRNSGYGRGEFKRVFKKLIFCDIDH
jgi:hypothetical protein